MEYFLEFFMTHAAYVIVTAALAIFLLLSLGIRLLNEQSHPLALTLRATRNWLLPTGALLYFFIFVFDMSTRGKAIKITETIFWIEVLWILLSLVKVFLFSKTPSNTWRSRTPGLLVDITRFAMIVIGTAFVIAGVWDRDVGGFVTTLGVGSLVIGLALQDTLGSLMAGIAILIERPFAVGDWIKVGDILGQVKEMNWRSVRLFTRDRDIVVVPNSVIGKDRIQNCSRPDPVHGVLLYVSFSYDDPPNKVKHVLLHTVLETRDILASPEPSIRTKQYQDFSIQYEMRFFTTNFERLPEIESDLMTKIWYAARRNNLTIPYPTRTIYKTEVPLKPVIDPIDIRRSAIKAVPLFATLTEDEIDTLARDAAIQNFARGEAVVNQGEPGDALYIIMDGHAIVAVDDERGKQKEIALFSKHDFFGERSLLTGEPRTASVSVKDDLDVVVIYKDALATLLERRPDLAQEIALIMAERSESLAVHKSSDDMQLTKLEVAEEKHGVILSKIKNFFGL